MTPASESRRRASTHRHDTVAALGATDPWRLVFWSRYVGRPLLAMLVLVQPLPDQRNPWLLALVILLGVPFTLLLDRARVGRTALTGRLIELDALTAAVALLLEPHALPVIAVVMTANVATMAAAAGRREGERSIAVSSLVLFVVAVVSSNPDLHHVAVHAVAGLLLAIVVGTVADGERAFREHHEALLEGVEGIVWESTVDQPVQMSVGGHVEAILGVPAHQLSPVDGWVHWIHEDDQQRAIERLAELLESQETSGDLEYRVIAHGGRIVHVRDHLSIERDWTGRATKVRGVVMDVTKVREAERELTYFRDIVEHIHTALIVVHLADPVDPTSLFLVAANPAASERLGRNAREHLGSRLVDAFPMLRDGPIPQRLLETITVGVGFDTEMSLSSEPDAPVFSVHTFPLPGSSAAMALQDVTDRARVQQRLRHQALHDALTGLPNRVLLNDRLAESLHRARRTREPVAMMIMDLDHFKEVNDTLGHHSGDLLLSVIARRLRESLREADTIARLGGDEFAIVLTTNAHRSGAEAVARKIAELVEEPIAIDGVTIQVGSSIGIAIYPEHADEPDGLARRADVAMYVAKRSGIPYAVYAPEDDRSSIRRLTLLGELRQAIHAEQLVLHHQPTIDLATGEVLRIEALLRWHHPEHGLMPPGEFVELAEMSGVIAPLTRWVLRESIRQVTQLHGDERSLHVAVNVSARNLYEPDLVDWLQHLLDEEGFPGERLTLEITESLLMDDPLLAYDVLSRLKRMGVSLSIDDFGTGYSSLSYLRDLPIDEIKIDQTFVEAMGDDGDDTIVRSVIDLGHNLGLAVVAEGVEDLATLERLVELGCDRAQGFLLSQPLPIGQLGTVLASERFSRFAAPGPRVDPQM
jgi:diguanylate cyclase (GGDEF)-like protein/PAS domain S-box-containing protein